MQIHTQITSHVHCHHLKGQGVRVPTHHLSVRGVNMLSHKSTMRPAMHSRRAAVVCQAAQKLTLYYFPAAARGETTRLLLNLGKVDFEDKRIPREQWAELKPKMPYGQMPVLEVDGKMLAQQNAIERYVAKMVGMYPTDAWEAAQVDAMVTFVQELQETFISTFFIKDPAEKLAARKQVVEGALAAKLTKLDSILAAVGPNGYLVGGKLTWADIAAYNMLSFLICGFFDGVPVDLYDKYPNVKAFRSRIASMPEIKAYYEKQNDPTRATYKP